MVITFKKVPMGGVHHIKLDTHKAADIETTAPRVDVYGDGKYLGGSVCRGDVDAIIARVIVRDQAEAVRERCCEPQSAPL